ncbi:hypothetical protein [Microcoleus vaginatus]|uniref:hypothetical protein n=1 Tax=Microcoleus vaginatus TaxID=119532 RepID=UPI00403F17E5
MKAESEVSIYFAISIFSNEKFTPDDYRLNYKSYEELGLICENCRELIFFKQGTKRISHFSHFRDTGKDCPWRTESHSNTLHTDAEGREQSLEKFQTKFKSIIEEGIIKHQQISSSQLREQIKEGKSLVSTYKIDIDSWLRWFNQNRKQLGSIAKSLYQTNELVSEENQIFFLNLLDYLCVSASQDILRDILYYVVGLLDKEISLKKYLEEVPSKVIELMSYTENSSISNTVSLEEVANPIVSDSIAIEEDTSIQILGVIEETTNCKEKESIWGEDGKIATEKEEVKILPRKDVPLAPKKKLVNVSDTKSLAINSLEWSGMIAHIPCKVTLVNSKDHWQLEALPIRDIPSYPLFYTLANKAIEDKWQEEEVFNVLISPIDKELKRLNELASKSEDPEMIQKIGLRESKLEKLKVALVGERKLDLNTLSECSEIVKQSIEKADYKPSPTDPYYSRYILAQVYFLQTNEDKITYLLDDYMSHKRTASEVQTAINFLKLVPRNLDKKFPDKRPTLKELQEFIIPLFRSKFGGQSRGSLELKVREERGKILIDVIYQDKIQLTQLLTIKMPATEGKNCGKVTTKVAPSLDFESRAVFEKFLRTKDGRFATQAMNQLKSLVQVFLSKNFSTLVGENKIGKSKKLTEIIGFERSKQGWGQIKRGFIKYMTPFTSASDVNKGKLVWLNSNKVLNAQGLREFNHENC